jgi:mannose/fructose/N-acetylgalactosamine-specific phosphotransferase system component IID
MTGRAGGPTPTLPLSTRVVMFFRLLAVQSAWNYETLVGNGIGFCVEPALRRLPGGLDGDAYRAALARESQYFNAHPYLTSVAVGALARAELDGEPPERIERFRTALCGPLGALGDRLVWATFLPLCSFTALAAFGLGASPLTTVLTFLGLYNTGHLGLRIWGLRVGWRKGLAVAQSLGNPLLQHAPERLGRLAAVLAGLALPIAVHRIIGPGEILLGGTLAGVLGGAIVLTSLHGRAEGWKISVGVLTLFSLYSVIR